MTEARRSTRIKSKQDAPKEVVVTTKRKSSIKKSIKSKDEENTIEKVKKTKKAKTDDLDKKIEEEPREAGEQLKETEKEIKEADEEPKETKKVDEKPNEEIKVEPKKNGKYPTNSKMPESYVFITGKPDNTLKLVSYNVNSLSASLKKGFKEYIKAEDPDILCIQETKLNDPMAFLFPASLYETQIWNNCTARKGYSGTAIFSKIKPLQVSKKIGYPEFEKEGRVITLEFEKFYLVACYVPNSGQKLERLESRQKWDEILNQHIKKLETVGLEKPDSQKDENSNCGSGKPVILTGDLNVSHKPVDLARPETNARSAGYTIEERTGFDKILEGRVDTFRKLNPDERIGGYSYYGYRFNSREKLIGWRLDYFVVSESIVDKVVSSFVRSECYGASDHVPIVMYLQDF
ncbi:hypothetical protein BB558_006108 [Smittium angustum]|uniref:DNA-(apurinic or apyrimidinic site) endonuclease n=1 Tax=Smittium angustum TaxID=133377 RepID=A0A2U1IYN0_SMIAN|nr:hypothetical protein BB558_006108 [Smittium angustum]